MKNSAAQRSTAQHGTAHRTERLSHATAMGTCNGSYSTGAKYHSERLISQGSSNLEGSQARGLWLLHVWDFWGPLPGMIPSWTNLTPGLSKGNILRQEDSCHQRDYPVTVMADLTMWPMQHPHAPGRSRVLGCDSHENVSAPQGRPHGQPHQAGWAPGNAQKLPPLQRTEARGMVDTASLDWNTMVIILEPF